MLSLINTDLWHEHDARFGGLDGESFAAREVTPGRERGSLAAGQVLRLAPGEARIFVNN